MLCHPGVSGPDLSCSGKLMASWRHRPAPSRLCPALTPQPLQELEAPLEGVTEWRCSAQVLASRRRRGGHPRLGGGSGSDGEGVVVCGFRHRLRDNAWHLWKVGFLAAAAPSAVSRLF